ncbi:MAG TPA: acetylxylan esterase [Chryseosolibacter sp.]|nr:acetylxylan esterase [Chryseosolibacter sp.]
MDLSRFFIRIFLPVIMVGGTANQTIAQDDFKVIGEGDNQWLHYTDASNALYHHLADEAYEHLEKRKKTIAAINSLAEWKQRQAWIKKTLLEVAGPFPAKTPLNAKVLKVVDKDFYRVEHIVYESQPQFYVTSSLFIPKTVGKSDRAPVVIYCSGHSEDGYRSKVYQHVILNLVKKGFIVFAFDPVGQGERLEYFDPQKSTSSVGGPTSEHSYPGTQAFVVGGSQARYMIWDGIRAVDYLLTRRDIDPARIGITGRSGGGTQSSYIAAFDERIKAAAPECYITSFTRLLQSIGPQDAEQNFFNGISRGLDHGDLLQVRAPKPTLMITTTRDMFSIQGARETAKEVSVIYKAYGQEENFGMVEDDAPHASTKKNRQAMYSFFQKHLSNPGNHADEEVALLTEAELRVTPTGQVSTSLGGKTVFSLNVIETNKIINALYEQRKNPATAENPVDNAKELSGYREPVEFSEPVFTGRIQREGYSIEKYFLKGEGDYVIPYLLMVPEKPTDKTILYLHPSGKAAEASAGGEMEWFVKNGYHVLAPDLPGIGELGAGDFKGDAFIGGVSHNIWYTSMLIGRSIVGIQAGDITRLVQVLKIDHHQNEIYGVARKEMTPLLLHAAAFNPDIQRVALIDHLISYRSLVTNRFYHSPFITAAVPGALKSYDLQDLAYSLGSRKLLIGGFINGTGEKMKEAGAPEKTLDLPQYILGKPEGHLRLQVVDGITPENFEVAFTEWLK